MSHSIKTVGIVGAGTMGQGIAQVVALAGQKVLLYDVSEEVLEESLSRIHKSFEKGIQKGKISAGAVEDARNQFQLVGDLSEMKADLVIEAALEDLNIKKDIFKELESVNASNTILATNTSSIPVTQICQDLENKSRFLGIHFFNPAHIMPLIEVVATPNTDSEYISIVMDYAKSLGKTPVLAKDSPGFIVNRVARHFYVESLKLLEDRVANVQQIDQLLEASGFKMGPFKLMDLIGVDTNYKVTETMFNQFGKEPKFRPSRIQKQLVDSGALGRKSGKGFYTYES